MSVVTLCRLKKYCVDLTHFFIFFRHHIHHSLAALNNLGVNHASNQRSLVFVGGIPVVMDILNKHGKSEVEIAAAGCSLLFKFCCKNGQKEFIGSCGGIDIVLLMMRVHGTASVDIAEATIGAIRALAYNDVDRQTKIGAAGGISLIVELMAAQGVLNPTIAEHGMSALLNLAHSDDNQVRCGAGKVFFLLQLLQLLL